MAGHASGAWLPVLISTVGLRGRGADRAGRAAARAPRPPGDRWMRVLVGRGPRVRRSECLGAAAHPARAAGHSPRAPAGGPRALRRARRDRRVDLPGLQMGVGFSLLPRLRAATRWWSGAGWSRTRRSWSAAWTWDPPPSGSPRRWSSAGCWPASITCRAPCSWPPSSAASPRSRTPSPRPRRPRSPSRGSSRWSTSRAGCRSPWRSAAAYVGAHWGLAGVIYGVARGGSCAPSSPSSSWRHLRLPLSIPAVAP